MGEKSPEGGGAEPALVGVLGQKQLKIRLSVMLATCIYCIVLKQMDLYRSWNSD